MARYKLIFIYPDGSEDEDYNDDAIFDTIEEAQEYGLYMIGCYQTGGEIMEMSNPGDYPYDEEDKLDFRIIEIE